jgi:hypothetical protein
MKVLSAKKDFGAVGDGKTDDTAALQKAFNRQGGFVWVPNGTYLVRDRILFVGRPGYGPTIQGESRDGVVVRLADDAKGFDNPRKPRAVVRLIREGKVSADYFKTRIRNLTIDAGRHRGAIGLMFYSNNNGHCADLKIIGQGAIGLDLSYRLNGPLLVSNVEIVGFDKGVYAGTGPYNSQTLEHIVCKGQRSWALYNDGESLSIRGLHSENTCPAVFTRGNLVLIDSVLAGGAAGQTAIHVAGQTFIRNVRTEGYANAIQKFKYERKKGLTGKEGDPVPSGPVKEWTSRPGHVVGGGEAKSLNLPVEEAPYQPLPPLDQWVCVDDFGAVGDGKTDDSAAVRKALDYAVANGKKVLCFGAERNYNVTGELAIRGSVERVQGARSYLLPRGGKELKIIVKDGDAPLVWFDLVCRGLGRYKVTLENASSRTVVVRNFRATFIGSGTGRTFLEDACTPLQITNPKHRVWARQQNPEGRAPGPVNINAGGFLWVLGIKTEKNAIIWRTSDGGRTEILGGWIYVIGDRPAGPMFEAWNAEMSVAGIVQWHWKRWTYPVLLDVKSNGRHTPFAQKDNDGRASFTLIRTPPARQLPGAPTKSNEESVP